MNKHKIYKVYTHTTPDGDVYVGVTCQDLIFRWRPSAYKGKSLYPYIEKYGWENIEHKVVFEFDNKEEALKKEDELIQYYRELGICINKQRSGLIKSKDNTTYQRLLMRQWRQDHREEYNAYMRQWREDHKEEWNASRRQHYLKKKQSQSENLGIAS